MTDYDKIYRILNPKKMLYNPYERQRELSDIWPSAQNDFKRNIDKIEKYLK
jgi:hypothetical protein